MRRTVDWLSPHWIKSLKDALSIIARRRVNVTTLTHAHRELFRRNDDERFESLDSLAQFCRAQ
jgi:hypothetical protein